MRYLNLGCGSRYHPDWINIDIAPQGPGVIAHDVTQGLFLPNASCDVVYHSDLIEHLRQPEALRLMKECYRVLRPGGILRVATPDLERICRLYLMKLEGALTGDQASGYDYEWMLLEMYDQAAREKSGGGMLEYLQRNPLPNEAFIYERIGEEGRSLVRALRGERTEKPPSSDLTQRASHRSKRRLRKRLRFLSHHAGHLLLACLLGHEGLRALEMGRFRLAGEVHHWMYDRYSLSQLMLNAGFQNPIQQSATQSLIPQWSRFNLDTLPDGTIVKPDSLFMEAMKPTQN